MADSTAPNVLLQESLCYGCIPTGMQSEAAIHLLNEISELDLTPQQLIDASRCYDCVPAGMQDEVQTMMLESIVTGLQPPPLPECSTDALAFITAAGITDPAQRQAICDLVSDLKSNGSPSFWERDVLIYPFVGGTAASHAVNLRSPGTYDLTFTGAGLIHNASGLQGNNSAYADTGYSIPSANQDSIRGMVYVDGLPTAGSHKVFFGGVNVAGMSFFYLTFRNGEAICRYGVNGASGVAGPGLATLGANLIQRQNAAQIQIANTSASWTTDASVSNGFLNRSVMLLGLNDGVPPPTSPSDARICGFSVGTPLTTDAELASYKAIWDAFQTALGRGHP